MKKRLMTFLCALVLLFSVSVTAMAADSPTGKKDTSTTTTKTTTSPKTGESNVLFYSIIGAVVLSGTAVISRKHLEELN